MLKLILQNKILLGLFVSVISLSIVDAQVSYASKNNDNREEVKQVEEAPQEDEEEQELSKLDMDIIDYLASIKRRETQQEEQKNIEEAKEVAKQATKKGTDDPAKITAALKVQKGVAKNTNASDDIKKYETNETSLGIDVSYANGKIDWAKVKSAGIHFAMIRVGFRGYGSGKIVQDSQFLNNIKGALANDINVGIYFFTGAATEEEAKEEARWTVNMIKNYNITFPVAIDSELFNDSFGTDPGFDYRLQHVSNSQLTTNAIAFSNYIKSEGYTPMIYSYANALTNKFETARFGSNRVWLAQYNDKPTYKGKYYMWQYTSNGSVPGINTRVDMNVAYFSVTNDVTKASSIEGVNSTNLNNLSFNDVNINTTLKKDVVLRNSNYNKVANLNSGTAIKITGISSSYIKVVYDLETYYIEDTNCFNRLVRKLQISCFKIINTTY